MTDHLSWYCSQSQEDLRSSLRKCSCAPSHCTPTPGCVTTIYLTLSVLGQVLLLGSCEFLDVSPHPHWGWDEGLGTTCTCSSLHYMLLLLELPPKHRQPKSASRGRSRSVAPVQGSCGKCNLESSISGALVTKPDDLSLLLKFHVMEGELIPESYTLSFTHVPQHRYTHPTPNKQAI